MNTLKRNRSIIHPGEILKSELIDSNGLTITEVASMLKVSQQALSNIINQKEDISPEIAFYALLLFL